MKKNIFMLLIVLTLIIIGGNKVNAETLSIDKMPNDSTTEGLFYLGDGVYGEYVSYNEMITNISERDNTTLKEVRNMVPNIDLNSSKSLKVRAGGPSSSGYIHLYKDLPVKGGWTPKLDIYVHFTYANKKGREFTKIVDLNLIRSSQNKTKQFSGKLQAKLLDSKNLYWVINGDFHDNGTTSVTFGGSVGIGKYATANFSTTKTKNHFAYIYRTGNL